MTNNKKIKKLKHICFFLKKKIIDLSYLKKTHHIGSAVSCLEILVSLYFNIMNVNKRNLRSINRDFFILSKGHAAISLYVTLMKKGFFNEIFLKKNFLTNNGFLGGHPDMNKKIGIDFNSGSLGHGLSVGAGVALAIKKSKEKNNVFVLLGDGECNEGMIWEALLFASHQKLGNLIAIVDYNKLQGLGTTTEVLDLEPFLEKFRSFGWHVKETNGHDIKSIIKSFNILLKERNKPKLLIAKTIKGNGIPTMINKLESHYEVLSKKKYQSIINYIK
jgi:transketolase